jgi:hypothetical protein
MVLDFADMDLVKNVPESITLPFTEKAVGDSYISQ